MYDIIVFIIAVFCCYVIEACAQNSQLRKYQYLFTKLLIYIAYYLVMLNIMKRPDGVIIGIGLAVVTLIIMNYSKEISIRDKVNNILMITAVIIIITAIIEIILGRYINIIYRQLIVYSVLFITYYLHRLYYKRFRYSENAINNTSYFHNQIYSIENEYKKIKYLRHDLNNHIEVLMAMARKDNDEKMCHYLTDLKNTYNNSEIGYESESGMGRLNSFDIIDTGNFEIDAIINSKIKQCINYEIDYDFDIKIPENINIKSVDMTKIIGNILDNAIKASKDLEIEQRKISFYMKYGKNILVIKLLNNYKKGSVLTNEKSQEHGNGLNIVREVVEKYNGNLIIEKQDIFQISIMIPILQYEK